MELNVLPIEVEGLMIHWLHLSEYFRFLGLIENDSFVDFSGEPAKYYGIHGKILELIGLTVNSGRMIVNYY